MSAAAISLHIHPATSGAALASLPELNLVQDKGIVEDTRYFGRRKEGRPSKRQVTLIEREVIRQHAAALGVDDFAPGVVRSNIETEGVDLMALMGRNVQVGEAVLRFVEPRTPCHQMEALVKGLRALMEDGRQGVIATVVKGGRIRVGDAINVLPAEPSDPAPRETN